MIPLSRMHMSQLCLFSIQPATSSFSAELKKTNDDYRECFEHVKEQNEIVKNLQLLQNETQQGLFTHLFCCFSNSFIFCSV